MFKCFLSLRGVIYLGIVDAGQYFCQYFSLMLTYKASQSDRKVINIIITVDFWGQQSGGSLSDLG